MQRSTCEELLIYRAWATCDASKHVLQFMRFLLTHTLTMQILQVIWKKKRVNFLGPEISWESSSDFTFCPVDEV